MVWRWHCTTVAVAAQGPTKFPCRQHRTFCLSDVWGRTRWYTKVCIRDVHGNGIPCGTGNSKGMGIEHRIGNGNRREWEATSVGMGITCTAMGIYSKVLCCDELVVVTVSSQQHEVRLWHRLEWQNWQWCSFYLWMLCIVNNSKCTICLTLKSEAEPGCERFWYSDNKWLGFLLLGTYYNYYRITNYIQL